MIPPTCARPRKTICTMMTPGAFLSSGSMRTRWRAAPGSCWKPSLERAGVPNGGCHVLQTAFRPGLVHSHLSHRRRREPRGGADRSGHRASRARCTPPARARAHAQVHARDPQIPVCPADDNKGRGGSSIGREKRFNARVAGKTREEFLSPMTNLTLPMPARIHEAVPANLEGGAGGPAVASALEQPEVAVQSVSAQQLAEALHAPGVHLLDVRTPEEFQALRISGSVNIPLAALDPAALLASLDANEPVYVVCQTGTRSQVAAAELRAAGFRHVVHVDGGTNAWTVAGLPVARGG